MVQGVAGVQKLAKERHEQEEERAESEKQDETQQGLVLREGIESKGVCLAQALDCRDWKIDDIW